MVTTTKLEAPSMSAKAKAEVINQCPKVEASLLVGNWMTMLAGLVNTSGWDSSPTTLQ